MGGEQARPPHAPGSEDATGTLPAAAEHEEPLEGRACWLPPSAVRAHDPYHWCHTSLYHLLTEMCKPTDAIKSRYVLGHDTLNPRAPVPPVSARTLPPGNPEAPPHPEP